MQHVPSVTLANVARVVRREFPSSAVADVLALLDQYVGDSPAGSARVRLAVIKLARGDVEQLRQEVKRGIEDFRDVIADAEYPSASRQWSALKSLSDTERQKIYDLDRSQYEQWLIAT